MTERWAKQARKLATDGWSGDAWAVSISDTVKLLARQHAAVVRIVKKQPRYGPNFTGGLYACKQGDWISVSDLLAALEAEPA